MKVSMTSNHALGTKREERRARGTNGAGRLWPKKAPEPRVPETSGMIWLLLTACGSGIGTGAAITDEMIAARTRVTIWKRIFKLSDWSGWPGRARSNASGGGCF